MNKLNLIVLTAIFSFSSALVVAADSGNQESANQINRETNCINGKCPGELAEQASNKGIKGHDTMSAEQVHQKFLCDDGKCPGEMAEKAGQGIIGRDKSTAPEAEHKFKCLADKCPGEEVFDPGSGQ